MLSDKGPHCRDRDKLMTNDVLPKLSPRVILLAGPAGAGKSTLGARIAQNSHWSHISEDTIWDGIGHPPNEPRTPEEELRVQARTIDLVIDALNNRKNVVLEFVVYHNPPTPIIVYQDAFKARQIPFIIRVLLPNVEEILRRQKARGRSSDSDLKARRLNAEHQCSCLSSVYIEPAWRINSTNMSLEEVYLAHFRNIVEAHESRPVET